MDKNYKDTMDKFFKGYVNNEYDDVVEIGEAILRELQRCLGTQGKFHKRTENGHEEVNNEAALQSKLIIISLLLQTRQSLT